MCIKRKRLLSSDKWSRLQACWNLPGWDSIRLSGHHHHLLTLECAKNLLLSSLTEEFSNYHIIPIVFSTFPHLFLCFRLHNVTIIQWCVCCRQRASHPQWSVRVRCPEGGPRGSSVLWRDTNTHGSVWTAAPEHTRDALGKSIIKFTLVLNFVQAEVTTWPLPPFPQDIV